MKRILGTLAVLAVVAAPSLAAAGLDAPHDQSFATLNCDNCHSLTTVSTSGKADYTLGCLTCHNKPGRLFPWSNGDQASPGVGGNHHSWSANSETPEHGARTPASAPLAQRLVDGKLQCAVCHDPHRSGPDFAPSSRKTTFALNVAQVPTGGPGGATMTLRTVGATAKAFRVKVSTAGGFIVSHDYGLGSPSWFNYVAGAWQGGVDNGPGRAIVANTDYALDDAAVTVRFSAVPPAGAFWDFIVSFPFLRASGVGDNICIVCHADRVMNAVRVRGDDYMKPNGTRLFSHPVGEALNSNGGGYDRTITNVAAPEILDANGAVQSAGDTKSHNDLVLSGNTVMCTTCHGVHSASSNALSP